jgi:hypothetical protein
MKCELYVTDRHFNDFSFLVFFSGHVQPTEIIEKQQNISEVADKY